MTLMWPRLKMVKNKFSLWTSNMSEPVQSAAELLVLSQRRREWRRNNRSTERPEVCLHRASAMQMSDVHANRWGRKWFELRRGHVGTRPTYLNMSTSPLHVNAETRGTWREKERQNSQKSGKNKPLWINHSRHAEPSLLHFSCTGKHQTPRDTRGRCRDGCWGLEPITVRLYAGS